MAQQARAVATRNAIVEAAAAEFIEHGFAGASIADIAERAGATKGAMYFHFKSKDLLAQAVIDRQRELNTALQDRFASSDLSALAILVSMVRALGELMRDDVVALAAMRLAVEVPDDDDVRGPTYDAWAGPTATVISHAKAQGDLRESIDPETLSRFLVAAFTGIQTASFASTRLDDLMVRLREMWTLLLPGIVAPGREHVIPDMLQRA
ncbi:ScbR family autoregulator-binding transcription factor [Cellulomonas persica]|uniref:TetR family transcriptional regulator n=1 Tax=Cellulomonas persica TaxID=76861 RepID=A0A510UXT9_9CELL|nr:ScbR family autoregulator-binding transcription factor [Cellulomonas persica]GEK17635.1 TetR family transcriptional regulator [Cellulomonas persica]